METHTDALLVMSGDGVTILNFSKSTGSMRMMLITFSSLSKVDFMGAVGMGCVRPSRY